MMIKKRLLVIAAVLTGLTAQARERQCFEASHLQDIVLYPIPRMDGA